MVGEGCVCIMLRNSNIHFLLLFLVFLIKVAIVDMWQQWTIIFYLCFCLHNPTLVNAHPLSHSMNRNGQHNRYPRSDNLPEVRLSLYNSKGCIVEQSRKLQSCKIAFLAEDGRPRDITPPIASFSTTRMRLCKGNDYTCVISQHVASSHSNDLFLFFSPWNLNSRNYRRKNVF